MKYSKLAIFSFIFSCLCIIGFTTAGIVYNDSIIEFVTTSIIDIAVLVWFYHIYRNTVKNNMKGQYLALFGVVSFFVGFVLWLALSFYLMYKLNEVKVFAIEVTPTVLTPDLSKFKEYAIDDLVLAVDYEGEFSTYKERIKEVGSIKECRRFDGSQVTIGFGPIKTVDSLYYGLTGSYGVRCYGEKKIMAVGVVLRKDKTWKISDIAVNADITNAMDVNYDPKKDKTKTEEK